MLPGPIAVSERGTSIEVAREANGAWQRTPLAGVGAALGAVAVLQVALGVTAVLLRLPVPVRAAHAAGGYALWALLVWLALRSGVWRAGTAARADRERAAAGEPVRSR